MKLSVEDTYREFFRSWRVANDILKPLLETTMDAMQSEIADGPNDPRWLAFLLTMPDDYPAVRARIYKRWNVKERGLT